MLDSQIVREIRTLVRESDTDLELSAHEVAIFYSVGLVRAIRTYRDRLQQAHKKDINFVVPGLVECKKRFDALPQAKASSETEFLRKLVRGDYPNIDMPFWDVLKFVHGGPLEDSYRAYLHRVQFGER